MRVIAAFLSNTLFNFVIGLLLARFLGPTDYGRFALAVAAAVMIQTIAFDWARLAAARFYSERVRTEQPMLRATLDASLALLIVGLVASVAGLLLIGFDLTMSPDLVVLAIGVAIANGVFDYTTALVRARFRDGLYMALITGKNALSVLLTVGGAYWFGSARAALVGVILSMAGSLVAAGQDLIDWDAKPRLAERRLAGTLFRYGLPIVLANLFYQTIPLVDRLVIARSYGLAQSGQFSFAYDIGVRVVAAVGSMLDVLLFQIAVKAEEHQGDEAARRQVGRNVGLVVAILAPACVGFWLVLPSFERLVVPAEFQGAFARNLALLLPGLFCYGVVFFAINPMFQIVKKTGPLVAVAIGASVVNLAALAVLPSATESFALAQALALSTAVVLLVVWAGRSQRPSWPPARDVLGVFGGTVAVAATAWWAGRAFEPGMLLILLQVVASSAVYGVIVAALDLCGLRTLTTAAWHQGRQVGRAGPAPLL